MRYVKLLSLAVVAAVAATALVGTGSASAWGFCKQNEEAPCLHPYTAGTNYTGSLEAGTTAQFTGTVARTCKSAGFVFEQQSAGHVSPVGLMEPVTFGNCNGAVAAVHLPWRLEIVDTSEGEGTWLATVSSSGGGAPGVEVGICTFTATTMEFEFLDSLVTGGSARMIGAIPLSGPCGNETMTVSYRVAAPAGTIYPG